MEVAAEEAGIPLEEAKTWLDSRREAHGYDDDSLRILSAKAVVAGMTALIDLAKQRDGRVKTEGGEFGETFQYDDVAAAKALIQAGLKMRGMLGAGKAVGGDGTKDLFDLPSGNWNFPETK